MQFRMAAECSIKQTTRTKIHAKPRARCMNAFKAREISGTERCAGLWYGKNYMLHLREAFVPVMMMMMMMS